MRASRRITCLTSLFFYTTACCAQQLWLHTGAGMANYSGDIQQSWVTVQGARPVFTVGAGYFFTDHLAARLEFAYTSLAANDMNNTNPILRRRNLSFKTSLAELHLGAEYHFLSLENKILTPYVFAGIGVYHFNPYVNDSTGSKVYLRQLSTEGQGLPPYLDRQPYNFRQFSVPYGGGIKWAAGPQLHIGLELGLRKLFTDYLDDLSNTYVDRNLLVQYRGEQAARYAYRGNAHNPQDYPAVGSRRGNPQNLDSYYFATLKLLMNLSTVRQEGSSKRYRRILRCPE